MDGYYRDIANQEFVTVTNNGDGTYNLEYAEYSETLDEESLRDYIETVFLAA